MYRRYWWKIAAQQAFQEQAMPLDVLALLTWKFVGRMPLSKLDYSQNTKNLPCYIVIVISRKNSGIQWKNLDVFVVDVWSSHHYSIYRP